MTKKLSTNIFILIAAIIFSMAFTSISYADTSTTATIDSCLIEADKNNIRLTGSTNQLTDGTDGKLYFFELTPYENNIDNKTDYIHAENISASFNFTISSNYSSTPDRIYNKFVAAVYDGTKFTIVSNMYHVTNPEAVATDTKDFPYSLTKKGLRIEIDNLDDAMELGVKHAGVDILFQSIIGEGIDYTYDGKTYHFSSAVIAGYDKTISAMSGKSITITAVILNRYSSETPELNYAGVDSSNNATHTMFNVHTQDGYEKTRAIISFLAQRYDGSNPNYGRISNWVIGNEINNQKDWNYMGATDLNTYVQTYEDVFRVFYTAIKSHSANDRVYFSLDQNWNNPAYKDGKLKYGGKEVVDTFNSIANVQGQIDWGLAFHPYPYPITEPDFWNEDTSIVQDSFDSPVITFKNINYLTDYFAQDQLKKKDGSVRHIILTEQGFTAYSTKQGKDVTDIQAAAYAYSYYIVDSNPYIDAYLLSREVDAPSEVNVGLKFGLWECDMNQPNAIAETKRRKIWAVFKNIDKKATTLENTEFAKSIIGIDKWSDVVRDFRWKSIEK